MKITFKKEEILKAIRTEKLKRGQFFHDSLYPKDPVAQTCKVCAVGAIMRSKLHKYPSDISLAGLGARMINFQLLWSDTAQIPRLIEDKNYLGALSSYFETVSERKCDLVKFINKHFPKSITVEIY